MKIDIASARYDRVTLCFHWLTALLVVEQWIGAHVINDFAKGAPRTDVRSVHITLGLLLGAVLIARIVWRATRGHKLPPADQGVLNILAKATHHLLYTLLACVVLAGICVVLVHGVSYFGIVKLPGFAPHDRVLGHYIFETHMWLANVILIVAGFHAAAALFHHYVWRDGVLRRMLPGTR